MSPLTLSRVKILRHFTGGGDSSVLGEEVSFGAGRGRCRIGLSRSLLWRSSPELFCPSTSVRGRSSVVTETTLSPLSMRGLVGPLLLSEGIIFRVLPIRLFCDGGRSCCLRVAFFDEVKDGGVGFLLPLPTPELRRLMLVHRVRCIMEGSWRWILRRFQCLELCFEQVDLALVSPFEVATSCGVLQSRVKILGGFQL
jgi:hypothetical protein